MLDDAWWDVAVENFLIFILRYISYALVAFLKLDALGQTASMGVAYLFLGLLWMAEGLFLLAILSELDDIKRYIAIFKKYDIWWWSSFYIDMLVAVAQQIFFLIIRLYWFHNIYYKVMTVNWKEYRKLRDELFEL